MTVTVESEYDSPPVATLTDTGVSEILCKSLIST